MAAGGLGLLGRWMIFLFLILQGCLPENSGHRSRVSVLEGARWRRLMLAEELVCLCTPTDLRVGL